MSKKEISEEMIEQREKTKRYLKRYKKNISLINRLEEKLATIDEKIQSLKSPTYSDMPKGGTPVTKEDLISDKLELEARINRLCVKGKRLKQETLEKIDELDDTRYAEVLESFMIDCKSFEDIGEDMGYTERHVKRLYSEAITELSY